MNKIVLIGAPNCGKSTLGRRTADIMHLPFFDTDLLAKDKLGIENPVDLFRFALNGRFLTAQYEVVDELAEMAGPAIIATGAEVALMPECKALLRNMGTIIHVQRNPEITLAAIKNKKGLVLHNVTDGTKVNMEEEALRLYQQEYHHYEALADLTLENHGSEDEGVSKLAALINSSVYL